MGLMPALEQRGWAGTMIAVQGGGGSGYDIEVLAPRWPSITGLARLRRLAGQVDVTIAHGSTALPAVALATVGSRSRFVYRNIGDPAHWASGTLARARVGWALRRASAIAALWTGARTFFTARYKVPADKVSIVPNGVDDDRFRPATPSERSAGRRGLDAEGPVVVAIGALSREKNMSVAIEAIAQYEEALLVIVGDGPERQTLEALAHRVASGRVRFAGPVADVRPLLAAADAALLTSRSEGIPAALIEAGMMGVPAVATNVGGVSEVVEDGRSGYLVAATASAEEIALRLRAAVEHGQELGDAARQLCTIRFSFDRVADDWANLLARVARQDGGR